MSLPEISDADVEAVGRAMRSLQLASGPAAAEFEERVAAMCGARHAVALGSGTAALHLALRLLDVGPGDEVLVPSFTFAASVNVILYQGARPVFVDVEPETYNLDPVDLERRATARTKAVMVVDAFGHPAEWDAIEDLVRRRDLVVVDDACEAIGAEYRGRRLGSFGDAAAFAFFPNKQMTTGEGGMLVTDDEAMAETARSLRNQGRGPGSAWLNHVRMGYNYRMDEMSAALGVSQLARLDTFITKRERVARAYAARLKGVEGVRPPVVRPHARMSWFVYVVTLPDDVHRDEVIRRLEERGIPSRGYFSPIHAQEYMRALGYTNADLPVTARAAKSTLALPFHNNLADAEVDLVVGELEDVLREARAAP